MRLVVRLAVQRGVQRGVRLVARSPGGELGERGARRASIALMSVILVHGLRTSATMWRAQLEALAVAGIPARAIDLPGHGTRMSERFTLDAARESIASAVREETAATGELPYLVGFSLGGYLSIDWVAAHQGRVAGVLAASCGTVPHPLVMGVWRAIARVIHTFPDRGRRLNDFAVDLFVPKPGSHDIIAGGVALEVMDDVLTSLLELTPLESLAQISEPLLFVNGRLDHVGLQSKRFLAAAQHGSMVTIPRATHMVSATHPELFTAAMLDGFTSTRATPDPSRLPKVAGDW